jgi:hypothetical protein
MLAPKVFPQGETGGVAPPASIFEIVSGNIGTSPARESKGTMGYMT